MPHLHCDIYDFKFIKLFYNLKPLSGSSQRNNVRYLTIIINGKSLRQILGLTLSLLAMTVVCG